MERFEYTDARGRTDAELYLQGALDGEFVAGEKIKQLAEKYLPRIRKGYKQWHYDVDAATRPVEFIERFCMIPSGKLGVPFVLEPYERMIVELVFGFVDKDGIRQHQYALVEMARKNGKALSLDTEIPTPSGWRTMRDIHPGDYVFGQDGKPSKVLVESEIFDKPMYLVTFEDGSTIKASADHLWTVVTKTGRRCVKQYKDYYNPQVNRRAFRSDGLKELTTQYMAEHGTYRERCDGKGREYYFRVPMCAPVEHEYKKLPIDPYVFGAWIGDGTSSKPQITIGREDEDEMVANLSLRGHMITKHVYPSSNKRGAFTYDIDHHPRDAKHTLGPFKKKLMKLRVLNNKHIPDIYMQASIAQRWELLRGLMDTDGYCSKAGECEFVQKRRDICEQVVELCASLGIKATMKSKHATCNGKPAGIVYRVHFFTDKEHSCFHLRRKTARLKDKLAPRMSAKTIVSVEPIPNEPSKCIAIDNESHLYLAGRQYTATHNTSLGAGLELYMAVADGEGAPQVYNAATSKSQASLAYGAVWRMVRQSPKLSKHLRKGTVIERSENGIMCDGNMAFIIPLSKQTDHLDGLDVHFALMDEMAAMEDRSIFDLVKQGMSAREQPLMLAITTQGFVRDNIWDHERDYAVRWLDGKIEDDRFLGILFEQDDRGEIWDEKMWLKSNPGLGVIKKVEFLRAQVIKAKNDSSYMPTLKTKDFNLPANQASAYLTFEESVNEELFEFDPEVFRYCVVGIDAADTLDLNAATALFMRPGDDRIYRRSMYWIAEEQVKINSNRQRGRDGVPYQEWASRGLIRVVEGNKVDHRVFLDWIQELADEGMYTYAVGYDRWHMDTILADMKRMVGEKNVEPVIPGAQTLSQPMKQLKADLRDNRIVNNHNPIDEWCNMNVSAKIDINDNVQPVKSGGATTRIDGFMALLIGYIALQRHESDYRMAIGAD